MIDAEFESTIDTAGGTVFDSARWQDPKWLNRERKPVTRYLPPQPDRPWLLPFGELATETQLELFEKE